MSSLRTGVALYTDSEGGHGTKGGGRMPGSVRAGYVLLVRELRRLLHDPAALLTILVAPFLLAVITSVSLGARPTVDAKIGVAGLAGGTPALAALAPDAGSASFSVREIGSAEANDRVRDGSVSAAIIVP